MTKAKNDQAEPKIIVDAVRARQRAPQDGAEQQGANLIFSLTDVNIINLAVIGGALASLSSIYPNPILKRVALALLAEIAARLTDDGSTDLQLSLDPVPIEEIVGATAIITKFKASYTADIPGLLLLNSLADSLTAEFQERSNREKFLPQSAN